MTDHTVAQVDDACAAAGRAAAEFGDLTAVPLTARAAFLRGIADRLDEAAASPASWPARPGSSGCSPASPRTAASWTS
jgi:acyl-CoA reductase-like NAD-dependent aldehyde dehydrogenase